MSDGPLYAIVRIMGDASAEDVARIRLGWELGGAEIARLRRIEEAAREITQDCDEEYCFSCHFLRPCAHDALRAALEEKP